MRSGMVILIVCLVAGLLSYAYSAEVGAMAATAQNHAEGTTTSVTGWAETGHALEAD